MGIRDWNPERNMLFSRLLFAFVNIGLGTSYILQDPLRTLPPRRFLTSLPVPFWVYGIIFIFFGILIAVASLKASPWWLLVVFQFVAVFWLAFSLAYLAPVFTDWKHIPWSGFVLFFFVGTVHQAAALVEADRV